MCKYTTDLNSPIYNTVHTGTLKISVEFNGERLDGVSEQLMQNGSVMGFVSEAIMAGVYCATHDHRPSKGFDLASKTPGLLNLEAKSATRHGAKLGPSDMYGAKRKYDHDRFVTETVKKDFIIADTAYAAETGVLRWIVKTGDDVVQMGHSLTRKKVEKLFSQTSV